MYKANLRHGGLQHADGNGDWVLTIFKAISIVSFINFNCVMMSAYT